MENYVKAALYFYPMMKRTAEDYKEHIKNKAYTSFDNRKNAEKLVEYMAGEVIKKRLLEELEERIASALERLTEKERFLLEARYFRRKSKLKEYLQSLGEGALGSKRSYFRRQEKLLKKLTERFCKAGLTEEEFCGRYESVSGFFTVLKYIQSGKELRFVARELTAVEDCFTRPSRTEACRAVAE